MGEVLDRGILLSEGRHPVVRTGEREPIPHHVRSAVWFRDRGRCELCGISERVEGAWHLDHITPWSAGGGDDTTNLRVLCEEHNIERSNHLDPTERTRMPATWWCDRCYGVERQPWDYTESGYIACPIHARSRRNACPVQRDYDWGRTRDDWEPWHQRRDVMDPTVVAYCAHCQMPGVTDVVL